MSTEEYRNALPLGREMQGYRIDSVLGAGGFGITYKATELSLEREVAIKEYLPTAFATRLGDNSTVVPASTAQEPDFAWGLMRFKQEAQVLIQLRHPNIVPVFRFFEEYGTAYLVMEYQHGDSLGGIIRDHGPVPPERLEDLLPPILDAIEEVHGRGFLHRDLKPDNIYVREDGSPVILDFGAARQAVGQRSASLTAIVSEGYAPYEQYEREGNQGPWTDIYALGAILYRCTTAERPVEAPARASAAFRGAPDPLVPAHKLAAPGYPPGYFHVIDQSMRILETERPQTIAEFRATMARTDPLPATPADGEPVGMAAKVRAAVKPSVTSAASALAGPGSPSAEVGTSLPASGDARTVMPEGVSPDAAAASDLPSAHVATRIAGAPDAPGAESAQAGDMPPATQIIERDGTLTPTAPDADDGPGADAAKSTSPAPADDETLFVGGVTGAGTTPPPSLFQSPAVRYGAIAAVLLLVAGGAFAMMGGSSEPEVDPKLEAQARRDVERILADSEERDADLARMANPAAGGNRQAVERSGPLRVLFAGRRLQAILPGRSNLSLIRFSSGGGLSAVTQSSDRGGSYINERGAWAAKGNAVCIRLTDWNEGKTACFAIKYNGSPKAPRVPISGAGRYGSLRGTLTY